MQKRVLLIESKVFEIGRGMHEVQAEAAELQAALTSEEEHILALKYEVTDSFP